MPDQHDAYLTACRCASCLRHADADSVQYGRLRSCSVGAHKHVIPEEGYIMHKTLISLAGLALLGACHSSVETTADGNRVIHVDNDITMSTHQPPKNLPVYAPLYPGSKFVSGMEMGDGGTVTMLTQDKPAAVIAFYEKLAAEHKLSQKMTSPPDADGTQADMISEPGTKRSLTVSVGPNHDGEPGTKVGLLYGAP
jgi:hypothetical protein